MTLAQRDERAEDARREADQQVGHLVKEDADRPDRADDRHDDRDNRRNEHDQAEQEVQQQERADQQDERRQGVAPEL